MSQEKVLIMTDSITVNDLAQALNVPVTILIGELFKNGIAATINQRLDFETAQIIVEELGLDVLLKQQSADATNQRQLHQPSDKAETRPPIVAVMGHVDHGKTSLLDRVLGTKVADREAGGITQHISAYQAEHNGRMLTLLDTPGHEAFAALRQHGASLTDVVIIVVAADDGVKPQTVEAIKFARAANAKILVAINKVDKPGANPQLVRTQLATDHNLVPEEWGGDTVMVEVSAKTGQNIDKLLDMVLLIADLEGLKADVDLPSEGLIIEAHMETGRGPVVNMLVEQGILRPSQYLVAGTAYGKVRMMTDFQGRTIQEAGPSVPVTVTGFKGLPEFGDIFAVVASEKEAKRQAEAASQAEARRTATTNVTGSDLLKMMRQQDVSQEFDVVVKADVQGSLTSVIDSLRLIETGGKVILRVVGSGVGNVTENDIRLAAGSNTIIYGFNVDISPAVKRLAVREGVEVRIFNIIYELIDDARHEMENLLAPEVIETPVGDLMVKGVFRVTRDSVIAGGEVLSGKAMPGALVRAYRGDEVLAEAAVVSVQRGPQEAQEVFEGELCGISLKTNGRLNLQEGDRLEFFNRETVKATL